MPTKGIFHMFFSHGEGALTPFPDPTTRNLFNIVFIYLFTFMTTGANNTRK